MKPWVNEKKLQKNADTCSRYKRRQQHELRNWIRLLIFPLIVTSSFVAVVARGDHPIARMLADLSAFSHVDEKDPIKGALARAVPRTQILKEHKPRPPDEMDQLIYWRLVYQEKFPGLEDLAQDVTAAFPRLKALAQPRMSLEGALDLPELTLDPQSLGTTSIEGPKSNYPTTPGETRAAWNTHLQGDPITAQWSHNLWLYSSASARLQPKSIMTPYVHYAIRLSIAQLFMHLSANPWKGNAHEAYLDELLTTTVMLMPDPSRLIDLVRIVIGGKGTNIAKLNRTERSKQIQDAVVPEMGSIAKLALPAAGFAAALVHPPLLVAALLAHALGTVVLGRDEAKKVNERVHQFEAALQSLLAEVKKKEDNALRLIRKTCEPVFANIDSPAFAGL